MIAFWFSGVLLVLYLFHVIYVLSKVPWIKIEFFFCIGAALLLGITSAVIIGQGGGMLIAAGVRILSKFDKIFSFYKFINAVAFLYSYRNAGNYCNNIHLSFCFVFIYFTVFRLRSDVWVCKIHKIIFIFFIPFQKKIFFQIAFWFFDIT